MIKIKNNAYTSLTSSLSVSSTTMVVKQEDVSKFPVLLAGDYFYVTLIEIGGGLEIVKVTSMNNNTWTIVRAQDGTSAKFFPAGSIVELRLNVASLTDLLNGVMPSVMVGATSTQAGSTGVVPVPVAGDNNKVLFGDGTWKEVVLDNPIATSTTFGTVKPDNNTITISNGVISSSAQTSITGNAGTATKLQTPRTIALAGDVSGSVNFDGSANVSITSTVVNNSHTHILENITDFDNGAAAIATHNANTEAHADIRQEIANGGLWLKETDSIVQVYPEPESPLDVTVSFALTETPPASGEKSPSNPSTISGVSSIEVVRCGKNLLNCGGWFFTYNGIPTTATVGCTYNRENGSFSFTGTPTINYLVLSFPNVYCKPGEKYTLSYNNNIPFASWHASGGVYYDSYGAVVSTFYTDLGTSTGDNNFVLTIPENVAAFRLNFILNWVTKEDITGLVISGITLTKGSTATEYTPYEGNTYTIPIKDADGNNDTSYGGYIDTQRNVYVKEWEEIVLDGTENWDELRGTIPYTQTTFQRAGIASGAYITCSHYASSTGPTPYGTVIMNVANPARLIIRPTAEQAFTDSTAFKSWLASQYSAGTPVKVAYKLATPVEIPLSNLPQPLSLPQSDRYTPKLNTVYSDQQSVDVGYKKSPIQEHTDITAAIIAAGGSNV